MIGLTGESYMMLNDEVVRVRRQADDLGGDTVVVDGKRVRRDYTEFDVRCTVQPVSGKELMQVPEGDRFDGQMAAWVADRAGTMAANDLVLRPGDGWYLVQSTEGWGGFTKILMRPIDVGPLAAPDSTVPAPLGLSLIHIGRCRRLKRCSSRWSPEQ